MAEEFFLHHEVYKSKFVFDGNELDFDDNKSVSKSYNIKVKKSSKKDDKKYESKKSYKSSSKKSTPINSSLSKSSSNSSLSSNNSSSKTLSTISYSSNSSSSSNNSSSNSSTYSDEYESAQNMSHGNLISDYIDLKHENDELKIKLYKYEELGDYNGLKQEIYNLKKRLCKYEYKNIYNITLSDLYYKKTLKDYIKKCIDDFITNEYDRDIIYNDIYKNICDKTILEYLNYDNVKINNFLEKYELNILINKSKKINEEMMKDLDIFNEEEEDDNIIKKTIKYYLKKIKIFK